MARTWIKRQRPLSASCHPRMQRSKSYAWIVDRGDIRDDPGIAREILEFIEEHRVRSVAITDGIIGCPHQQGIDYEGEWCPVCEFWHGRDRFAGQRVH